MKLKWLLFALVAKLSLLSATQAGVLTHFSIGEFHVEHEYSTFMHILPQPNGLWVGGTDFGDQLSGTFTPGSIYSLDSIYLTASVFNNPGSYFAVHLYNSNFEYMVFNGWFSDFSTGISSTIKLDYLPEHQNFAPFYHDIMAFELFTGGVGSPISMTFESLSSVPEPHTYAFVLSSLLIVALIVRRKYRPVL